MRSVSIMEMSYTQVMNVLLLLINTSMRVVHVPAVTTVHLTLS